MKLQGESILAQLMGEIQQMQNGGGGRSTGQRHDVPVLGAPKEGLLHGPGGLLSYPSVDPNVFHTIVGTRPGILGEIPWTPTLYTHPTFEVITGVKADGAGQVEPDDACEPYPVGGVMKGGIITAPYGRVGRRTRQLDISRIGQRTDRNEPTDLRLVGRTQFPNRLIPGGNANMGSVLTNEVDAVLFERGISLHRKIGKMVWNGNPDNNLGAGEGYREFAGLQLLVNTGAVDAYSNTALPSLDGHIRNFGYADVSTNGDALVNRLTYMWRVLQSLAADTGVDPVRHVFVMREALFYEVTKVWPCSYLTYTCSVVNNATDANMVNMDAGDIISMRDGMRQNRFLLIDGEQVPVIFDDFLPYYTNTTNANVPNPKRSSDIYILPLSIQGGRFATLYGEYFQFNNADVLAALARDVQGLILEGGMWFETISQTNRCFQWEAIMEPRLILRTPWLAGRLQNVVWNALETPREALPDDPYWVNGGVTQRIGPSFHKSPWD